MSFLLHCWLAVLVPLLQLYLWIQLLFGKVQATKLKTTKLLKTELNGWWKQNSSRCQGGVNPGVHRHTGFVEWSNAVRRYDQMFHKCNHVSYLADVWCFFEDMLLLYKTNVHLQQAPPPFSWLLMRCPEDFRGFNSPFLEHINTYLNKISLVLYHRQSA